jgi:cyclopropane fatty-acyl-phospholipid synthase-like methyltransferase
MDYCIKPGYRINTKPAAYLDTLEDSRTYQLDVYRFAVEVAQSHGTKSVLDIGCGLGTKLQELLAPVVGRSVGVDCEQSIEQCQQLHPAGEWRCDDIEAPRADLGDPFDLIVSADVIEHLIDPDKLLAYVRRNATAQTLVILSTPERDLRRGSDSMGPPGNRAHVREWNQAEFAEYLRSRGFRILVHRIMDLRAGMRTCQTVLCRTVDAD